MLWMAVAMGVAFFTFMAAMSVEAMSDEDLARIMQFLRPKHPDEVE